MTWWKAKYDDSFRPRITSSTAEGVKLGPEVPAAMGSEEIERHKY